MATFPGDLVFQPEGQIQALAVAQVTFYFTRFDEAARLELAEGIRLCGELVAEHATYYRSEPMKRARPIKGDVVGPLAERVASGPVARRYHLELHSGSDLMTVGPWAFAFGVTPSVLHAQAAYLSLSAPAAMLEDPTAFLDLVLSLANTTPYRSGHAGYGIGYNPGYVMRERNEEIRAWCSRYRGLDASSPATTAAYSNRHCKGVNWLTMLDDDFCLELGGTEKIEQELGNTITLHQTKGGLALQAGHHPRLGDKNQQEDMAGYRRVNELVRPLRMPDLVGLPGMNRAEGLRWLARFDEP
ncbi:MAG: DUF3396 domain-containing protein [Myxococcales bacterium]|nr:DUF3396 domain-containing protein [Myxococcales bacterium]